MLNTWITNELVPRFVTVSEQKRKSVKFLYLLPHSNFKILVLTFSEQELNY